MPMPPRRASFVAAPIASATLAAALALLSACTADVLPSGPENAPSARRSPPPANTPATFGVANDEALGLRGDARVLDVDGFSSYADGTCGAAALVYSSPGASGDAVLSLATSRKCARSVSITYQRIEADGSLTPAGSFSGPTFLNVRRIHRIASDGSPEFVVPVNSTVERTLAFDDGGTRCGTAGNAAIAFVPVLSDGTVTGADQVLVTRVAPNEWRVETKPDETLEDGRIVHHDKAWCRGTGELLHMPLRLTIRTASDLSP